MKLKLLSIDTVAVEALINESEIFPNSPDIVKEWIGLLEAQTDCSPLKVCFDGVKYFLFDGYHRLEAIQQLGFKASWRSWRPLFRRYGQAFERSFDRFHPEHPYR